eukprot:scaffold3307_cov116-Skeletonema_dohrnii-CCMP3373.AAC.5
MLVVDAAAVLRQNSLGAARCESLDFLGFPNEVQVGHKQLVSLFFDLCPLSGYGPVDRPKQFGT